MFSIKAHVVGSHLIEVVAILMSTHKIFLYVEISIRIMMLFACVIAVVFVME